MIRSLSIVGAGRTGRTLGRLAARAGMAIGAVVCRSEARAREAVAFIGAGRASTRVEDAAGAEAILVAVPDDALVETGRRVSQLEPAAALRWHCCGVRGHEVFATHRAAAIHPLRSFADPELAARQFAGTWCFWDASEAARDDAVALIEAWGGRPVEVRAGGKALYHAAAVFASNYVVVLMDVAEELLAAAGVEPVLGRPALWSLAEGVMANMRRVGTREALTGPVERGDAGTVARHVEALMGCGEAAELYRALARRALEIARARGSVDEAAEQRLREKLES